MPVLQRRGFTGYSEQKIGHIFFPSLKAPILFADLGCQENGLGRCPVVPADVAGKQLGHRGASMVELTVGPERLQINDECKY